MHNTEENKLPLGIVVKGKIAPRSTGHPCHTTFSDFLLGLMLTHSELRDPASHVVTDPVPDDSVYMNLRYQFPIEDCDLIVQLEIHYKNKTRMLILHRQMFAWGNIQPLSRDIPHKAVLSKLSDHERMQILKWFLSDKKDPCFIQTFGSKLCIDIHKLVDVNNSAPVQINILDDRRLHTFVIEGANEHIRMMDKGVAK